MAFKRIAGASGIMSKTLFLREVLGDGVPLKLAEVRINGDFTIFFSLIYFLNSVNSGGIFAIFIVIAFIIINVYFKSSKFTSRLEGQVKVFITKISCVE